MQTETEFVYNQLINNADWISEDSTGHADHITFNQNRLINEIELIKRYNRIVEIIDRYNNDSQYQTSSFFNDLRSIVK